MLDRMLRAVSIERNEVFITSVVKCRPPNNRTPLIGEIQACLPYLHIQIESISPKAILALGEVAARALMGRRLKIKDLR